MAAGTAMLCEPCENDRQHEQAQNPSSYPGGFRSCMSCLRFPAQLRLGVPADAVLPVTAADAALEACKALHASNDRRRGDYARRVLVRCRRGTDARVDSEPGWHQLAAFVGLGMAITAALEWATLLTGRWEYSGIMPVIPFLGVGLLPLLTVWCVRRQLI